MANICNLSILMVLRLVDCYKIEVIVSYRKRCCLKKKSKRKIYIFVCM